MSEGWDDRGMIAVLQYLTALTRKRGGKAWERDPSSDARVGSDSEARGAKTVSVPVQDEDPKVRAPLTH